MKEKLFVFNVLSDNFVLYKIYTDQSSSFFKSVIKCNMLERHIFDNACISYKDLVYVFYGHNYHLLCHNNKIAVK